MLMLMLMSGCDGKGWGSLATAAAAMRLGHGQCKVSE